MHTESGYVDVPMYTKPELISYLQVVMHVWSIFVKETGVMNDPSD